MSDMPSPAALPPHWSFDEKRNLYLRDDEWELDPKELYAQHPSGKAAADGTVAKLIARVDRDFPHGTNLYRKRNKPLPPPTVGQVWEFLGPEGDITTAAVVAVTRIPDDAPGTLPRDALLVHFGGGLRVREWPPAHDDSLIRVRLIRGAGAPWPGKI